MARAILSCLGIGVAAAAATAGAAHLSADPSLMFAAGSALGGVAGNLGTDLFKILNRSVAERWLEGRSGIDENHHIAQALRLAQMRGLQVVCDRFDSVWPGDNDELRRAIAENFSDQLREFLSVEIAAAAKPGFPAALMRDTEERKLRAEVLIGLPNAFGETLAVRRAGNEETGLLERQHQIRNMVERAVLAEISLSVAPSERKLPPTFIAAFEGAGFADSWFDLFIRDAADRLVHNEAFAPVWNSEQIALGNAIAEANREVLAAIDERTQRLEQGQAKQVDMLEELLDLARRGGAIPKAAGQGASEKTALYMIVNSPKEHYGPLLEASLLARDIPALSLLLSRGADPADSTVSYGSPLELVLCEHDDDDDEIIIDIIELFFRYGADPNQVCMHGSSLIAQLAPGDEANIMGFILQHGADVDFQDKDGQTCLMQSAMWGSPDCLRLLLDCGANVNIADQEGRTALMHACAPQHFDEDDREIMAQNFAELLVAAGADIGAKDFQDRTAADYAAEYELYKVESFLRTRTLGGVSIPG